MGLGGVLRHHLGGDGGLGVVADQDDLASLVEVAVADGAIAHSFSVESLLARDPQSLAGYSRGYDDRLSGDLGAVLDDEDEPSSLREGRDDVLSKEDRAEGLGLGDPLGKDVVPGLRADPEIVLYLGSGHRAVRGLPCDDDRHLLPGGMDGGLDP